MKMSCYQTKAQLEAHNNLSLTDKEFARVLNHLNKGNVFERAKILRDKMQLCDGTSVYLILLTKTIGPKTVFRLPIKRLWKVPHQPLRCDPACKGLPLVQVELKRRGLEMKEAFNQPALYPSLLQRGPRLISVHPAVCD